MGKAKKETAQRVITPAEKKKYQSRVINAVKAARRAKSDKAYDNAVRKLCDIAGELEYKTLWAYWQVTESRHKVDERAVEAIARVIDHKNKSGWCHFTKKEIERQIKQSQDYENENRKKILDKITDAMIDREDLEEAGIFFDKLDPETQKEVMIRRIQNQMKALDKLKAEYEEHKKENPGFRIESLEG